MHHLQAKRRSHGVGFWLPVVLFLLTLLMWLHMYMRPGGGGKATSTVTQHASVERGLAERERKLSQMLQQKEEEHELMLQERENELDYQLRKKEKEFDEYLRKKEVDHEKLLMAKENAHKLLLMKQLTERHSQEYIHVVFTSDRLPVGMIGAMSSVLMNTKYPERIYFHIVTNDPEPLKPWIESYFPSTKVELATFDAANINADLKVLWPHRQDLLNPLVFARVYLPIVFPHLDKVIYFDDDIAVQGDVSELWNLDMDGYAIAVVESCKIKYRDHFEPRMFILNETMSQDACYFNIGVMVVDLVAWKAGNYTARLEYWMRMHAITPLYHSGLQGSMSIVFYDNFKRLDPMWNVCTAYLMKDLDREKAFWDGLIRFRNKVAKQSKKWRREKSEIESEEHCNALCVCEMLNHAKALHWNGHRKPWTEDGVFKKWWDKFGVADPETVAGLSEFIERHTQDLQ